MGFSLNRHAEDHETGKGKSRSGKEHPLQSAGIDQASAQQVSQRNPSA